MIKKSTTAPLPGFRKHDKSGAYIATNLSNLEVKKQLRLQQEKLNKLELDIQSLQNSLPKEQK